MLAWQQSLYMASRAQMYKGDADWKPIAAVKDNPRMQIPVFGNGDVNSPERAQEIMGCLRLGWSHDWTSKHWEFLVFQSVKTY